MIPALEALERLREGNRRFVENRRNHDSLAEESRRREVAAAQEPFAIILGCSDSRVPAEIIFDQGLGDLFVIRVAGNVVAPSQIGSVEFAAERYHTRLVVVLGHSQCGAILATLLWLVASEGLSFYIAHMTSFGATYGSLGAVAGVMLWLYATAYAVLLGAELNAQIEAFRHGN